MEHGFLFILIGAVGAFFMAFNNGANDVANAFASAVGSKALKLKQAILIASIVVFSGAVLLGGNVATKLIEQVIDPSMFPNPEHYILAMLTVMLAAGCFVLFSTFTGMPVSSSHAIVGSFLGVCVTVAGWGAVRWGVVGVIVLSWFLSPFLAGLMSMVLCTGVRKFLIGPGGPGTLRRLQRWLPLVVAVIVSAGFYGIVTGTAVKKYIGIDVERVIRVDDLRQSIGQGLETTRVKADAARGEAEEAEQAFEHNALTQAVQYAELAERDARAAELAAEEALERLGDLRAGRRGRGAGPETVLVDAERWQVAIVAVLLFFPLYYQFRSLIRKWLKGAEDNAEGAEGAFKKLQIGTSCYVAFGIGANDVANSISPVFAVYVVVQNAGIPETFGTTLPFWILGLGGVGMATGIALLGWRVMKTLGESITKITNSRGFVIDFSVATTVVSASALGLPVSTTHAATGAVVGSGLSTGWRNVQFRTLGKIVVAWLITLPSAALMTIAIYKLLEWILF